MDRADEVKTVREGRPGTWIGVLARLAGVAILLAAGPMGWVLEFGDSPGGRAVDHLREVAPFFLVVGFAFGVLGARGWRLAALAAWTVAPFAAMSVALMRSAFSSLGEWASWAAPHVLQAVVLPVIAALAGGYLGARVSRALMARVGPSRGEVPP